MLNKNIGIMQGRLSPSILGKIQSYPEKNWETEFHLAKTIGFASIEWIIDLPLENNLLLFDNSKIIETIEKTGVRVESICADIYMQEPIFNVKNEKIFFKNFESIIHNCKKIGANFIEVPFVDNSSLNTSKKISKSQKFLKKMASIAKENNIMILLELDMKPSNVIEFLFELDDANINLNYDMGNSASLGYDHNEEISVYGNLIKNIHVKDRVLNGVTVPLGFGNVNFQEIFHLLNKINYQGSFVLQTARDADDYKVAKIYFDFVGNLIDSVNRI